ncbi:MAG TPA: L,D-transpeptidase family protein [Pyrinomonadaceae bacterium]|nr:L,D-transpeptidase family protein [Pyrinomonadaceae bacterium]
MKLLPAICLLLLLIPSSSSGQQALTRSEIKEAEQRLAGLGYWTGAVDGRFDTATRWALIAFQKYEGRTITGKLTITELEAIRNTAAPKPRDSGYAHVEVDLDRQVLLIIGELTESADGSAHSKVRVLPVSTGNEKKFLSDGQESIAYTPRGRFVVYDKSFGWENGQLGSVYYANYISGGVAIHGYLSVPNEPASHGCIRIPMFAAREVSKLLKLGTIVLVYDTVSFVSAKEWARDPKLKEAAMLNGAAPDYVDHTDASKNKTPIKKARPRITRT